MAALTLAAQYVRRMAEANVLRDLADCQLLERFTLKQDEAAFAELVRRHGPMVLSTCRRVLRHEQDAEDAFQAAFLVLARKAGSIRQGGSVAGWLYRVAYRLAWRARSAGRQHQQLSVHGEDFVAPAPNRCGDALVHLGEELERLPEKHRSAMVLCYLEGRTQSEAARLLATTAEAVNSRLKRARDLLRQRLVRRGLALSPIAFAEISLGTAQAALPPTIVRFTTQAAVNFASNPAAACGASALAIALAKGALDTMIFSKIKILFGFAAALILLTTATLLVSLPALGDDPAVPAARDRDRRQQTAAGNKPAPPQKGKPQRSVILLWMSGGPSQIDTFDPKPNSPNGGQFMAIDTAVKGVQISQHLPRLAKLANHLAIIRSMKHREGDHQRATHLMRTGYTVDGTDYPTLGCVLGKELGEGRPDLPRYIRISSRQDDFFGGILGSGYLGPKYAPLAVQHGGFGPAEWPALPAVEAFEALSKRRAEKMRKSVAKAFELGEEKPEIRDAYGPSPFGKGCLLARRLVEKGVPVVEVTLGGWDTHQNNFDLVQKRSAHLDAGWSALLKDLDKRKLLPTTLVVWMGEFGRTPRINAQNGRDHWPNGFTVVLAGAGIKGGQVIGKTSADATQVTERPVSPAELLATVYQAVGIDPNKKYSANPDRKVPLVEKGTRPVKEALR